MTSEIDCGDEVYRFEGEVIIFGVGLGRHGVVVVVEVEGCERS